MPERDMAPSLRRATLFIEHAEVEIPFLQRQKTGLILTRPSEPESTGVKNGMRYTRLVRTSQI